MKKSKGDGVRPNSGITNHHHLNLHDVLYDPALYTR
jgi:hypothetical protein